MKFGHMVGCAPANPLLVTGNAGLFSAGVVTKAVENLWSCSTENLGPMWINTRLLLC